MERLFSLVTAVKTKARNRLNLKTLLSILRLKTLVSKLSDCCKNLQVTGDMLNRFGHLYEDLSEEIDEEIDINGIFRD